MASLIPSRPIRQPAATQLRDSLEECITQHHVVQPVQLRLVDNIAIDKEEHRQIDFFAGTDLLLFKAEALDFGEIRSDLFDLAPALHVNSTFSGVML